jgi:hypothetical protein
VRDFRGRLEDILDAISQIEVEQVKGRTAFEGSPVNPSLDGASPDDYWRGGAQHLSSISISGPRKDTPVLSSDMCSSGLCLEPVDLSVSSSSFALSMIESAAAHASCGLVPICRRQPLRPRQ